MPWLATLWVLVLLLRAHLLFMHPALEVSVDEGYISAFGLRMLEARFLPYVDGVSHRGPLLYWVGAAVMAASDASWVPMRIAALLVFAATVTLTFLCSRRGGHPFAGAVAGWGLAFSCLITFDVQHGLGFNGEILLDVFAMAAFLALLRGLQTGERPPATVWVGVAGALGTLGALTKQVGVVTLVPLGLWVLAAAVTRPALARRARWALVLAFAGGALLPLFAVVVIYAVAGELRAFYYYLVTYNFAIYLDPYRGVSRASAMADWVAKNPTVSSLALLGLAWGAARLHAARAEAGSLLRAYDREGFALTAALGAATAVLGAQAALRPWDHYLVQTLPWCGLVVGLIVESVLQVLGGAARARVAATAAILVALALVTERAWASQVPRHRAAIGAYARGSPLCAAIQRHSTRADQIYVWGFAAELYVTCRRRPASRYVFSTFPAGFVPWFEAPVAVEDARAVPGARDTLIADLEGSRARLIVDAYRSLGRRSMRRYAQLAAYLDQHYHWVTSEEGADVYQRGKRDRRSLMPPGARGAGEGPEASPPFVIDRARLAVVAAGAGTCAVTLEIEGSPLHAYHPSATDQSFPIAWDVHEHRGKTARLLAAGSGPCTVAAAELYDVEP